MIWLLYLLYSRPQRNVRENRLAEIDLYELDAVKVYNQNVAV